MQLVEVDVGRGLLEDERKFWKLHEEYTQDEVEDKLRLECHLTPSGPTRLALMDEAGAVSRPTPELPGRRSPAKSGRRSPDKWLDGGSSSEERPGAEE